MSTVADIMKAALRLDTDSFLKLRTALDRVEERLWARDSARVTAKHQKRKLTDSKIDALVSKRRYPGQRP